MAAVAIASASVAYNAAGWATEAAKKDGQALQQRAEQDRILQVINIELAADARLWPIYAGHDAAAAAVRAEATAARATDPARAGALDLENEAHIAAENALWPLFQADFPVLDAGGTLTFSPAAEEQPLLQTKDRDLRHLDPEARRAEGDALHKHVLALVFLIVVLIGALLVMTIAQVVERGARFVAAFGIGLALGAAAEIGDVDPSLVPWLVGFAVGASGLFGLWWLVPSLRGRLPDWITSEEEGAGAAETSVHGASRSRVIHEGGLLEPGLVSRDRTSDRVGRFVAFAMAAVTLLAGVIGYRQAVASHEAANQAQFAQDHALMALDGEIKGMELAEAGIFAHARAIETQVAASSAQGQLLYWRSIGDLRREGDLDVVVRAREAEAKAAADIDPIKGEDGPLDYATSTPTGDPAFPNRYRVKDEQDALMHEALQDASNEASATLTSRGRDYTFGIAILAVVLYLLGLSLVLRANALRIVFFGASAILVLLCLARVVPALTAPDPLDDDGNPHGAEAAAMHYSQGRVTYQTATTKAQFSAAVNDLQQAIKARPDFGRAYVVLSDATLYASSPQQSGYLSVDDPSSRRDVIQYLQQAQVNGVDTPQVRLTLAFLLYRQAIDGISIDPDVLSRSIDLTSQAIEDLTTGTIEVAPADAPDLAVAYDNLGIALVAAGRTDEAQQAYDASIKYIRQMDEGEAVVAGALTDLDNLSTRHDAFRDEVERMKATLVSQVWPPGGGPGAKLDGLAIADFSPAMLQWTAKVQAGVSLVDHVVVLQWYRQAPQTGEWYALPDMSGLATATYQSGNVWYSHDGNNGPDGYFGQGRMTSASTLECLAVGDDYRLEVYVDGVLAGEAEITVGADQTRLPDASDLRPVDARDLGLAFCRPPGWTLIKESQRGIVAGYVGPGSPDPARGMFVFRVQRPKTADGTPGDTAGAIDEVLSDRDHGSLLPSMKLDTQDESAAFYGLSDVIERWYLIGSSGQARLIAGAKDDGSVIVAVVYGATTDFDTGGLGLRLVDSILPHD